MTARTLDLDSLTLESGAHSSLEGGACLLEAASYLAGERWTDHPVCVSPVLGAYGRRLNDGLPDGPRQQLKAFLPAMLADAAAAAVADAAAAAAAARHDIYSAVYRAVRAHYETSDSLAHVRALRDQQQLEAVDLFGRMLTPVSS